MVGISSAKKSTLHFMKTKAAHLLNRIAIIGCGHVGATSAYSILMNGTVEELVIIDEDGEKLLGEVMDLQHAVPLSSPVRIWAGDYEDAAAADIVVIAAGAGSKPGEMPVSEAHPEKTGSIYSAETPSSFVKSFKN